MGCFSLELFARRAGYTEVIYQGLYQRIRFLGRGNAGFVVKSQG